MAHSDDQGLVLPPALAPIHLVIVPIFKTAEDLATIKNYLQPSLDTINGQSLVISSPTLGEYKMPLTIKIDEDDQRSPGWKYNEYELKGVPLRIAIGARDMAQGQVELYRRDTQEKQIVKIEDLATTVITLLHDIQANVYTKHQTLTKTNTYKVDTYEEFKQKIEG